MRKRTWKNGILGGTPLNDVNLNHLEDDIGAALLALAADPSLLFSGSVTRDANGVATSASLLWPDGTAGVYSGTPSTTFPGSVDAFTVTYAGATTLTVTQPAVTRDAAGRITNQPARTIA
ncbi:hypothetical protein J7I84_08780 [Arthrobacter sp. ISL-85]|uniref:hypothetical protein n=1 Tax=Arthrobacter sp. ISL-85 TaxID=2819115 RepID=UPI001BEC89E9|nr:hypothetical protein [Arthrobacter sp. ISL-85]MBT2566586.1 hypothetical protein [Arthrobacter sp. ISL-85]